MSRITGSSATKTAVAGATSAPKTSNPALPSSRAHSQRTARKPANGIHRNNAYVGWTTASTADAAATETTLPTVGRRMAANASASAAGTSSWRDAVAGSASAVRAPP